MTAVQGKNEQCVTGLLNLGARLDLQDQHGDTVYHHAVLFYPEIIPVSSHIPSPLIGIPDSIALEFQSPLNWILNSNEFEFELH